MRLRGTERYFDFVKASRRRIIARKCLPSVTDAARANPRHFGLPSRLRLRHIKNAPEMGAFAWRRRRDSNPRGLSPKRFSRPPRYDRFDTPAYFIFMNVPIINHQNKKVNAFSRKNEKTPLTTSTRYIKTLNKFFPFY